MKRAQIGIENETLYGLVPVTRRERLQRIQPFAAAHMPISCG